MTTSRKKNSAAVPFDFPLRGQVIWLMGAKRVGLHLGLALAQAGADLFLTYRSSKQEAETLANSVRALGRKVKVVQMNAANPQSVKKAVQQFHRSFDRLDGIVNLASIFYPTPLKKITPKIWQANIDAHLLGSFWVVQELSDVLPRGAHIVLVTDRTALGKIYPNYLPYVVTKSAVAALTRALAVELGERGIFVNAVAPGPILKPADISEKEWQKLKQNSRLQTDLTDEDSVAEFTRLTLYLLTQKIASGNIYPLDLGKNL